jgi:two-component system chemotaxis response regulator CheY
MKFLIADDSSAMRRVFRAVLQSLGNPPQDILDADCGAAVKALYADPKFDPDLVIADGDLKDMDGLALLRFIKGLTPVRFSPVILCVNSAQRNLVMEATKLGLRDHVVRPFADEDLKDKIGRITAAVQIQRTQQASDILKHIVTASGVESDLPFLLQLPSTLMAELLASGVNVRQPAGSVLLQKGQRVEALHVIISGEVELFDDQSSRQADPVGMGDTFGEVAFMAGQNSPYTARAKTAVDVLSLDRMILGELVRRDSRLSHHLSALAAAKSRVLAARAPARSDSEFFGSLNTMPFSDLVQLMNVSQKNGVLSMEAGSVQGGIVFVSGDIKHAWLDRQQGEDAFYALAGMREATFSFKTGRPEMPTTIKTPTISLLMEAMRRVDEAKREEPAPTGESPFWT